VFFLDENPEAFRRAPRNPPKRKESESAHSASAGSESGSDSSGSGDSDSDSDSDSSASETSRVKKPIALQIRNLSGRSNGEILLIILRVHTRIYKSAACYGITYHGLNSIFQIQQSEVGCIMSSRSMVMSARSKFLDEITIDMLLCTSEGNSHRCIGHKLSVMSCDFLLLDDVK
jgi:hypothetical protein